MEKTWEIREKELREKIAARLEAECLPINPMAWNQAMSYAIKIVRGQR
jgi:hypothetical protein